MVMLLYSDVLQSVEKIFAYNCLYISRFPSLGIPRLELENLRWNTLVMGQAWGSARARLGLDT